ncbi:hypothetical protein VP01_8g2 [Puccinia sorghi]|uniref:Uncharacterized protein n=1 Tax=Puccinia sorghi TaxID=27349 RepID=A0A0L6U8G1_9BASI|nr:hypothetical protein VP01_8g2 [Puccinia sorghi]
MVEFWAWLIRTCNNNVPSYKLEKLHALSSCLPSTASFLLLLTTDHTTIQLHQTGCLLCQNTLAILFSNIFKLSQVKKKKKIFHIIEIRDQNQFFDWLDLGFLSLLLSIFMPPQHKSSLRDIGGVPKESQALMHSDCAKTSIYANSWSLDGSLAGACCICTFFTLSAFLTSCLTFGHCKEILEPINSNKGAQVPKLRVLCVGAQVPTRGTVQPKLMRWLKCGTNNTFVMNKRKDHRISTLCFHVIIRASSPVARNILKSLLSLQPEKTMHKYAAIVVKCTIFDTVCAQGQRKQIIGNRKNKLECLMRNWEQKFSKQNLER